MKMPNWKAPGTDGVPYVNAPTYSSATKSYPWWRKTLTRLDDRWKDSTVPKRTWQRAVQMITVYNLPTLDVETNDWNVSWKDA